VSARLLEPDPASGPPGGELYPGQGFDCDRIGAGQRPHVAGGIRVASFEHMAGQFTQSRDVGAGDMTTQEQDYRHPSDGTEQPAGIHRSADENHARIGS
jgi:hypothetical protein